MLIRINGRFLTQPITGVQQYARRFSKYLLQQDEAIKIITPLKSTEASVWNAIPTGHVNGQIWEQWTLPKFLMKQNQPLLINFCNSAPRNYKPQIVTIHDLAFRRYPHTFHPLLAAYYNWLIPQIAKKAICILTVSETIAEEINHYYKIPSSKIRVIYNTAEILKTKNIREKFMLTVGTLQPRKNYRIILEAFLRCTNEWQWVIVGRCSANFRIDKALIHQLKNHSRIQILENISEDELNTLYRKASVLVSASKYEGFNLPVLEAIQNACPVLISDIPVHRELYSSHAEFFDINSADAAAVLAEKINSYNMQSKHQPTPIPKYTMEVQGPELLRILQEL